MLSRRRLPILALTAIAMAVPASAAHAGTASVGTYQTCVEILQCKAMQYETRQVVSFNAGAGETNAVTISRGGNVVTVRDTATPVAAGPGCTSVTPNEAACEVGTTFYSASATLGDGNDSAGFTATLLVPTSANGGPGDDQLRGTDAVDDLDGGAGRDTVNGEGSADKLSGGDDRDADTIDGGGGVDLLDYSVRTSGVTVNLALSTPSQGAPGENDAVTGIENLDGGTGADVLRGGPGRNIIAGGDGNDTLAGGDGDDALTGGSGADNFDGGAGNDDIGTSDKGKGIERVRCGSGRDSVGQTDKNGGDFGDEARFLGPDLRDILGSDCERAVLPTATLDEARTFAPRLTRRSSTSLSIANPCRRRGCTGRVRIVVPGVRKAVGGKRFSHRGRTVRIGISAVGARAVRRKQVLAVGVRVSASKRTYAASYRTRAAR